MKDYPLITFATPRPEEVWRAYIGDKIKVRELNNGTVQVATEGGGWREVRE